MHVGSDARLSDELANKEKLSFPMLYDFDGEVMRHYRSSDAVLPLNVVVDRDGKIAYVGADFAEAQGVVQALFKPESPSGQPTLP